MYLTRPAGMSLRLPCKAVRNRKTLRQFVGAVIDRPRASNARPYKITGTSIRKDTYVYTLYHGRALLFRHGVDAEF